MIDKKISIGSILTIGTIIVGAEISYGNNSNRIDTIEVNETKIVKRVKANEEKIVDLQKCLTK